MQVKVNNGIIEQEYCSDAKLRKDNLNISFPKVIDEATRNEYGVFTVQTITPPTATDIQKLVRGTPELINSVWTETYSVEYLPLVDAQALLANQVDSNTRASILDLASENKQRNYLAKYNELLEKKFDGIITSEETTQMQELKALWATIETLVNDGNAKEVQINDCATMAELELITT